MSLRIVIITFRRIIGFLDLKGRALCEGEESSILLLNCQKVVIVSPGLHCRAVATFEVNFWGLVGKTLSGGYYVNDLVMHILIIKID